MPTVADENAGVAERRSSVPRDMPKLITVSPTSSFIESPVCCFSGSQRLYKRDDRTLQLGPGSVLVTTAGTDFQKAARSKQRNMTKLPPVTVTALELLLSADYGVSCQCQSCAPAKHHAPRRTRARTGQMTAPPPTSACSCSRPSGERRPRASSSTQPASTTALLGSCSCSVSVRA